jgi:hypothetical protein
VNRKVNLADPDFEPTDEELQRLAKEAFAEIVVTHQHVVEQRRARIQAASVEALRKVTEAYPELVRASSQDR